jgi:hypothetical protein
LVVDDFADANLCDLDAAGQARAGIAIQDGAAPDAIAACFKQSVLLGVEAETGGEVGAALGGVVAARTAALVAVGHASRRAVVSRAHDAFFPHYDAANAPLHAIAPMGGQIRQAHEILIPGRSESRFIGEVEGSEGVAEGGDGGSRVEELELSSLEEGAPSRARGEEMCVVAKDEVF